MATTDLATLKAAAVVDARGSACPGPLMELIREGAIQPTAEAVAARADVG